MVTLGIVSRHKISAAGLEVDQAKFSVIKTLIPRTTVKGIISFFGQAGFYKRFRKDFSKNFKTIMHTIGKGCQI